MTDRELYEFIDVEEMLNELGVRNVHNTYSGEIQFSCPFPGHSHLDSSPSATMSIVERPIPSDPGRMYPKTSFYCFGCGMKGTAINFVAEYEGVSPVVAKRFLRERFAADYKDSDKPFTQQVDEILSEKDSGRPTRPLQQLGDSELHNFEIDWFEVHKTWRYGTPEMRASVPEALSYMFERGFEVVTLEKFDIGFDDISSRITIPYRDDNGVLIGFKGRAWWPDAKPKYKSVGGEEYGFGTCESSRALFGLSLADLNEGHMIVREGEFNAMMLHQLGYTNSVGMSGKILSRTQILLIKKYADSATMYFDDVEDALAAARQLEGSIHVWVVDSSENDPVEEPDEVSGLLEKSRSRLLHNIR